MCILLALETLGSARSWTVFLELSASRPLAVQTMLREVPCSQYASRRRRSVIVTMPRSLFELKIKRSNNKSCSCIPSETMPLRCCHSGPQDAAGIASVKNGVQLAATPALESEDEHRGQAADLQARWKMGCDVSVSNVGAYTVVVSHGLVSFRARCL